MSSMTIEPLSQAVLTKLFAVLKGWADDMDPFRYEMFARRLIAAEHGRPDAVKWAQAWHNELEAEEHQQAEYKQRERERLANQAAADREEFHAGRCSNPHYQAYLDTVEHPELIKHHGPYMAWIAQLAGKFERIPGLKKLPKPEQNAIWRQMLQAERDAHLAPRLKGVPTPLYH